MSNTNIEIRKVKSADAKAIVNLIVTIWEAEYGFEVNEDDYPDLHNPCEYYHEDKGGFWVALDSDAIIGTIAYNKLSDNIFVLKRLFVSQRSRGQGVAQQLLNILVDDITNKHSTDSKIYLSTKENEALAAKALYFKNGFVQIDRSKLPDKFPYFYKDDLFMMKLL